MQTLSSYTVYPNTPESDLLPEVLCRVHVQLPDGSEDNVVLMAEAPDTALDLVHGMSEAEFITLKANQPAVDLTRAKY